MTTIAVILRMRSVILLVLDIMRLHLCDTELSFGSEGAIILKVDYNHHDYGDFVAEKTRYIARPFIFHKEHGVVGRRMRQCGRVIER